MQSVLIFLGLFAAGVTQVACSTEEDALEDVNSLMQLPASLQHKRLQPKSKAKRMAAKVRNAKRMLARLRGDDDDEDADWPTPDDPALEITEEDREKVREFKLGVDTKNVTLINKTAASMALRPVDLDVEEDVYEYQFRVLRDYQADKYQYLQQMTWRGLSDQSGTEKGSYLISNFGGPNEGIKFMVDQLLVHPFRYGYCADQLTVQYEILACISGLLLTDNNNTRGPAAVEEGLVPAVMRTLMGEGDLIASAHTACRVMSFLFWRNPQYVRLFRDAGAPLYVDQAYDRFKDGDDTPFIFGFTMGEYYNISACDYPIQLMALEDIKDEWAESLQEWKPWLNLNIL